MKFLVDAQLPRRLLVATGNIDNRALETLFQNNLDRIEAGFADHRYLELGQTCLVIHE